MKIRLSLLFLFPAGSALLATPPAPTADAENSGLQVHPGDTTDAFQLSWWGIDEHFYFIEHSENLQTWSYVPIFEVGEDDVLAWGFSSDASPMFFRVLYTDDPEYPLMQSDLDGDGLTVFQEYNIGSDPFNPDTSGDGIFDGIALKLGLSVSAPEPADSDPGDTTAPAITLRSPEGATILP